MTAPVARVAAIDHQFGDVGVLEDVSFELAPETVTALVGPNGSGKTTLLRILAGLLSPTAGTVERPSVSRPVGYLPQHPSFRPTFTVAETLGFYASLLDEPADVEAALEAVGLLAVRDRRVAALSGGMVRLLGLAQAIMGAPPLVVLDEPTSDLDPGMTAHIADVVTDRAEAGAAVLLATHDLDAAAEADDVLVLDRGRIVARGTAEALLASTGAASLRAAYHDLVGESPTVRGGTAA